MHGDIEWNSVRKLHNLHPNVRGLVHPESAENSLNLDHHSRLHRKVTGQLRKDLSLGVLHGVRGPNPGRHRNHQTTIGGNAERSLRYVQQQGAFKKYASCKKRPAH